MSFDRPLLENWTPAQAARMENAIFVAQHRLHELDMFSDERIVELIDRHPCEQLGINTMGTDPVRREDWQEGTAGDCDAETLFEASRSGKVWLNLRRVMDHHSEYRELVDSLYDQLEQTCPGQHTFQRSANLLISSPTAIVYYHLDCPVNMLWHIRGTKRVWAYPLESGIVSDETIEGVLCGEKSEELDFQPEWDEMAVCHDLQPGEIITWPQHTPHRVVNTGGLNISLSTEHMTRRAQRRNNVYLANRHFRQLLPGEFRNVDLAGWRPAAKEFLLRVARRIPAIAPQPPQGYSYPVTFEVDPTAPGFVRSLANVEAAELATSTQ